MSILTSFSLKTIALQYDLKLWGLAVFIFIPMWLLQTLSEDLLQCKLCFFFSSFLVLHPPPPVSTSFCAPPSSRSPLLIISWCCGVRAGVIKEPDWSVNSAQRRTESTRPSDGANKASYCKQHAHLDWSRALREEWGSSVDKLIRKESL